MPASVMSRLSISGGQRSDSHIKNRAAQIAKDIADREMPMLLQRGLDSDSFKKEYVQIYHREYHKYYLLLQQDQQSIIVDPVYIYVPTDNPSARKFHARHTVANFSKMNCFIHVHRDCITVGRISYPIDEDNISPETKEAFLSAWPGPLDRHGEQSRRKITDYVDTLWQHDSQRRIRYCISSNDEQRKTILKLLTELLHRNGSIDAPGITRLLLKPEQTEIQKDEGNRKPLETLQKYLLLGKRGEAIKFAKSRKLWDHAQCLGFLDKYQPPNTGNYVRDGLKLKDDSIVQLNDEYISATEHGILNTVYRSLLNRILSSDPESLNIIKHPNVNNDAYYFAILSANDCEMDFDQTNEAFKLIVAVKQAILNPSLANSHLISLGYTTLDGYDPSDDISYDRSLISFRQADTYASRTLTISNIDMLILNEIWEYCLNLARGTCNSQHFDYIIDLVPYKLIFASRLLDFGMHSMFAYYLSSIKNALLKVRSQPYTNRDAFYDWTTIQKCVEHLSEVRDIFCRSPETLPQQTLSPETVPIQSNNLDLGYNPPPPPQNFNPTHSLPNPMVQNDHQTDYPDSSQLDYPSLPYQGESAFMMNQSYSQPPRSSIPPPLFNQLPAQEEVNDFNPESEPIYPQTDDRNSFEPQQSYNDYSNEPSRRQSHASQSMEMPVFSPPSFGPPGIPSHERNQKAMTSSSPVNKARDSLQSNQGLGDSFNSPFSPINEFDDLPNRGSETAQANYPASNNLAYNNDNMVAGSSTNANATSSNNNKSQPAGDQQQPGFFTNLVGSAKALLPKSNSKQMILPDDSKKTLVWNEKKKGWVDTSQPEGSEDANNVLDAPPMMPAPTSATHTYSLVNKSSKSRYPKA